MNWDVVANSLTRPEWIEPAANTVQGAVRSVYAAAGPTGRIAKNFLHGTWLGHPLHSVLVDLPVGAWMAAALMDVLEAGGNKKLAPGADAAIAAGLVGAASAAVAGATDWHVLDGRVKRLGFVHMLFNVTATTFYGLSLVARATRQRGLGRLLAFAGFTALFGGAFLGGHLTYAEQVGVDHTQDKEQLEMFRPALPAGQLGEGALRRVEVEGAAILLAQQNGTVYALSDICSHMGCSLAQGGKLEGDSVRCHCHGSRFALADGKVLDGPSTHYQPVYEVRTRDGQIEVRVRPEIPSETGG